MKSAMGWKVPFRRVYCDTFVGWLREILWIFLVLKFFPNAHDFVTAGHLDKCIESPSFFHDQYLEHLVRARGAQRRPTGVLCGESVMGYPLLRMPDGAVEEMFPTHFDLTSIRKSATVVKRLRETAAVDVTEQDLDTDLVKFILEDAPA